MPCVLSPLFVLCTLYSISLLVVFVTAAELLVIMKGGFVFCYCYPWYLARVLLLVVVLG